MKYLEMSVNLSENANFEIDGHPPYEDSIVVYKRFPNDIKDLCPVILNYLEQIKVRISGDKEAVKRIGRMIAKAERQITETGYAEANSGKSYIRIQELNTI